MAQNGLPINDFFYTRSSIPNFGIRLYILGLPIKLRENEIKNFLIKSSFKMFCRVQLLSLTILGPIIQ
ncbi:LOW QUALITY PROTEIN: hypothetical protein HZS_2327 [Henneguya salminicola]|nr:LOW QUALITY PROTEIN: hypothetical protein HZS_2327 [Henneguya salminicola]